MKELLFGGVKLNSIAGDFGLLILRVGAGVSLALAHGYGKVPPSPQFVGMVEAIGLPAQSAWLAMVAEFVGGFALAAGFLTRLAALFIAGDLSVATFLHHASDPYARKELPVLFLAIALMFLFVGAGRFSIDRIIKK